MGSLSGSKLGQRIGLLDFLRKCVPEDYRPWDKARQCWWFSCSWNLFIADILKCYKFSSWYRGFTEHSIYFKFQCPRMLPWSLHVFFSFTCLFNFGEFMNWDSVAPCHSGSSKLPNILLDGRTRILQRRSLSGTMTPEAVADCGKLGRCDPSSGRSYRLLCDSCTCWPGVTTHRIDGMPSTQLPSPREISLACPSLGFTLCRVAVWKLCADIRFFFYSSSDDGSTWIRKLTKICPITKWKSTVYPRKSPIRSRRQIWAVQYLINGRLYPSKIPIGIRAVTKI